jgi:hypothetical protein
MLHYRPELLRGLEAFAHSQSISLSFKGDSIPVKRLVFNETATRCKAERNLEKSESPRDQSSRELIFLPT